MEDDQKHEFFNELAHLCRRYSVTITGGKSNRLKSTREHCVNITFESHEDLDVEVDMIDEQSKYDPFDS